ncbi:MAG: hypothetical protein JSV40_02960, partial [Deltaproteobacteria bacterium]
AALSLSKGMRRGQDSPADKSQKRPAREPRNERKAAVIPVSRFQPAELLQTYYHIKTKKETVCEPTCTIRI